MKKKLLTFLAAIVVAVSVNLSARAQTTLTLNLQAYPKDTISGGYWSETYNSDSTSIQFGEFVFSHSSGWGGMYWDGFTYATNGDLRQWGVPCPVQPCDSVHGGSQSWIDHQWGVMAGGGITSTNPLTIQKGKPYLIGYWGYYEEETTGISSLQVNLANSLSFTPQEIYICSHPWPYWGNIYGDGFARPLNQNGDYFKLWIHAIHNNGTQDSVQVNLAINYQGYLIQSPNWQRIGLSGLGTNVEKIYFTMATTDADPIYGPNTAVYFCMDKLKVITTSEVVNTSAKAKYKSAKSTVMYEVNDDLTLNSYTGGIVTIYNVEGKKVLETNIKAGSNNINLSKLPVGKYRLQHGHKLIPITKLK